MNREKRREIYAFNALLFLLAAFIHVSSEPIQQLNRQSAQFMLIVIPWHLASFVTQGFVFLSGLKLFLNDRDAFNYPRFIWRRFLKIYLPYVLWTAGYCLYFWQRGIYGPIWPDFGKYLLLGNIVSPFYFIVVIMQFYLLTPMWRPAVKKLPPAAGIGLAIAVTLIMKRLPIPYNDRLFTTYLFYWIMGCYAGRRYEGFKTLLSKRAAPLFVCVVSAAAADMFLKYRLMAWGLNAPCLEELHTLYGAAMILVLAYCFSLRAPRPLQKISGAGFTVFLSHVLFINIINERLDFYGITKISVRFGVRLVFVYALSLLLGLLWNRISTRVELR
ncbi:MAG: acyltransferase [Clostridiales bacterium]|jgi:membrane-bound acyltransferase YfiQ involved in biofilm formation|nr:acyltransferase [Clostridiales bacterium]